MGRVSIETRRRIVLLRTQGHSVQSIQERLNEDVISRVSIHELLKKYKVTGTVADLPCAHLKIFEEDHLRFIDKCMKENDESTARQLCDKLIIEWPELSLSVWTVRRARHKLGWRATRPKYYQLVRETNKKKRLDWCNERLAENDQFDNVVFTDECSVQLDSYAFVR